MPARWTTVVRVRCKSSSLTHTQVTEKTELTRTKQRCPQCHTRHTEDAYTVRHQKRCGHSAIPITSPRAILAVTPVFEGATGGSTSDKENTDQSTKLRFEKQHLTSEHQRATPRTPRTQLPLPCPTRNLGSLRTPRPAGRLTCRPLSRPLLR